MPLKPLIAHYITFRKFYIELKDIETETREII